MAWALEVVRQKRLEFIRISFLIAGHTKFAPDLVFAKIAQMYFALKTSSKLSLHMLKLLLTKSFMTSGQISPNTPSYLVFAAYTTLSSRQQMNWCAKLGNYATLVPLTMLHFVYKQAEVNRRMSFQMLRGTTQVGTN